MKKYLKKKTYSENIYKIWKKNYHNRVKYEESCSIIWKTDWSGLWSKNMI